MKLYYTAWENRVYKIGLHVKWHRTNLAALRHLNKIASRPNYVKILYSRNVTFLEWLWGKPR